MSFREFRQTGRRKIGSTHRNAQMPLTKKRSVQLQESNGTASRAEESDPKEKLKDGQPHPNSKLTRQLRTRICGYVADGLAWKDAAAMCGINRNVIAQWKARGEADPVSPYGEFLESARLAELEREHVHLSFIARDRDWKARKWLLCNFRPDKYRMNTFSAELSGPDGLPLIPAENPFEIKIVMGGEPEKFEVMQYGGPHDGEKWQWDGNVTPPWERNGESK
jgi:hypothetical protein